MTKSQRKLWTGLLIMALLTPLGIILPEIFNAGDAWGEWSTETLEKLVGYMPEGLQRLADLWKAPVTDYNFGGEGSSMTVQIMSYIASGLIGIAIIGLVIFLISRFTVKNGK
ncbi:MAG: cobalamin biosynthesis protein [Nitrospiraceae bacterium]|nr:MAG: cobalamin biosynthesis protein [Nitrospiraceae bacterium]